MSSAIMSKVWNLLGIEREDEEEFDFDKEYSDEEDEYNDVFTDRNTVEENVLENSNDEQRKIINIDEIMKVRVNNTLACANKNILNQEIDNMKLLNDFTFDQEIGYIVCNLLDSNVRAASEDNIIISFEYDSIVKQNLMELEKIIYVYNKITNSNKKIAIITDEEWENEKNNYIKSIKDGKSYQVMEEPKEIYEEIKKNDIISNSAVELFGDIVEIN